MKKSILLLVLMATAVTLFGQSDSSNDFVLIRNLEIHKKQGQETFKNKVKVDDLKHRSHLENFIGTTYRMTKIYEIGESKPFFSGDRSHEIIDLQGLKIILPYDRSGLVSFSLTGSDYFISFSDSIEISVGSSEAELARLFPMSFDNRSIGPTNTLLRIDFADYLDGQLRHWDAGVVVLYNNQTKEVIQISISDPI